VSASYCAEHNVAITKNNDRFLGIKKQASSSRESISWESKNNDEHKKLRRFAVDPPKCRRSLRLTRRFFWYSIDHFYWSFLLIIYILWFGKSHRCRQVIVPSTTPRLRKTMTNVKDYAASLSALTLPQMIVI